MAAIGQFAFIIGIYVCPSGQKTHFMGSEFAQWAEWSHEHSIEWHLLQYAPHQGIQKWVKDLNHFYRNEPPYLKGTLRPRALNLLILAIIKTVLSVLFVNLPIKKVKCLAVCNFTPATWKDYRIGVAEGGYWKEILNSDAAVYGGSNQGNGGGMEADPKPFHGKPFSLSLTIPPLGILFLKKV